MDVLRVMSFNACLLPPGITNAGSGDDKEMERMRLFFSKFGFEQDVLLLSEVWDALWTSNENSVLRQVLAIANQYNFKHSYHKPREWYQLCNNGLVILSRFPIKNTSSVTFRSSAGLQWFIPNGAIGVEVPMVDSDSVHLFTTHIHAGSLDTACCNSVEVTKRIQKEQIIQVKELIQQCVATRQDEALWICSGDFNIDARGDESVSADLLLEYEVLKNIMGSDSLLKQCGFPSTYPVPESGSFLVNKDFIGEKTCIDHSFSSSSSNIRINVHILEVDGLFLSDHAAISMELTIQP